MATKRLGRSLRQRGTGSPLELALQVTRMAPHPDDHVGDHRDGDRPDDGLQALLLTLRQVGGDDLQRDADGQADSSADRTPIQTQRSCAA